MVKVDSTFNKVQVFTFLGLGDRKFATLDVSNSAAVIRVNKGKLENTYVTIGVINGSLINKIKFLYFSQKKII